MGGFVEINDVLQLTREQGFPAELVLERHQQSPFKAEDFAGKVFAFANKPKARIYPLPPVRCFLVENIEGKWLYWGHCLVIEQSITSTPDGKEQFTSGKYIITKIYDPRYQKQATVMEIPTGYESYF